jgi:putative membrane protein insertion efficiency factor
MPARAVIFAIELYRVYVSPMRLPTCRFTPTCSQYAVDAISQFGLLKGSGLAVVRLAKCGPWHRGGWDPIPLRHSNIHRHDVGHEVNEAAGGSPAQQGKRETCAL